MIKSSIQRIMSNPYGALQGLIAVNKPKGKSSADVIRILQRVFRKSPHFSEPLGLEQIARNKESGYQKKKRRGKSGPPNIKMGHGGTLDPMATGVLVLGVNGGTKHLQHALDCQKSYECVALFGCSTDTYDAEGKIMRRAPYKHITKEAVEGALKTFCGDIMQKPPIYSALHQDGMRLYEYARKGIPLPMEIKARPVVAHSMELLDFSTDHTWEFPKEELSVEDQVVGKALGEMQATAPDGVKIGEKRHSREEESPKLSAKKIKSEPSSERGTGKSPEEAPILVGQAEDGSKPVAASIRMTVGSGFYVRSLVYDLGEALGSAAHMVKLVRTHQGDFKLGENVVEWEDLMNEDISVWEDKVVSTLRDWEVAQAGVPSQQENSGNTKPTATASAKGEPIVHGRPSAVKEEDIKAKITVQTPAPPNEEATETSALASSS
ncbi:pseudouridine synthase [Morchella snyderi]|nr:pseudouridine synthase [Morchella snyderi]